MRVLICDDDPIMAQLLEATLNKFGFAPIVTESAEQALILLSKPNPPRLAILDWELPSWTGVDICRKIREQNTLISIHVIILTSRNRPEDIATALSAGANDYLKKPFHPVELMARLELGRKIVELRHDVKTLTGLLPVCSWCKKVKDVENNWVPIEHYITQNTHARVSHSACPECTDKIFRSGS